MGFFNWLVMLLGLTGGVWTLFYLLEFCAPKGTKKRVSNWVSSNLPVQVDEKWPSTFVNAFDGLFGTRFLSLRFVLVSAILSFVCTTFLFIVWGMLRPAEIGYRLYEGFLPIFFEVVLIFIVTNLFIDYLSNCQTRYVLGRLVASLGKNKQRSAFYIYFKWLLFDMVLTVSLSAAVVLSVSYALTELVAAYLQIHFFPDLVGAILLNGTVTASVEADSLNVGRILSLHSNVIRLDHIDGNVRSLKHQAYSLPYGVFFYTTVLTSVWLWMYAISGAIVRMAFRVLGPDAIIIRNLDFDHKPLSSLGGVSALFVGILFIIFSVISLF